MYNIGDLVIIKSTKELNEQKIKYNNRHVIDAWAGTLCVVIEVHLDFDHKFNYTLCLKNKDNTPISGWFWEEYELKPADNKQITVSEEDLEKLLCSV